MSSKKLLLQSISTSHDLNKKAVAEGRLPMGFALPAGIGDIITGLAAIPLAFAISSGASSAKKRFVAWNIFGLLDLVLAVSLGILHSPTSLGVLTGAGPATLLMSQLPRSMVPTFLVRSSFCSTSSLWPAEKR